MLLTKSAFASVFAAGLVVCGFGTQALGAEEEVALPPEQGCSFRSDPSQFLNAQRSLRAAVHGRTKSVSAARFSAVLAGAEAAIVKRNFIDEEIFGLLERKKVAPAQLSSDEDFIRRIYLDITGRIPSAADVKVFVNSNASDKRDRLIEALITSPEFVDKWSVWFQDLVGMTEIISTGNRQPRTEGRNHFDTWVREQIRHNRPLTEMVRTTLTTAGNNYFLENGPANFTVLGSVGMGPAQDTYDMMLSKSVTAYLGLGHYDCLLCHSGRGKMDTYKLSLWGSKTTRSDAQRMAAHFSRVRLTNVVPNTEVNQNALYNSTNVADNATGTYDLNTNFGNRPNRTPVGTERNFTPEYRDGTRAPAGNNVNWRQAFAEKLINDPLFAVNFTNRIWKEFMGFGLVDQVDALDPDRLDPNAKLPEGWSLQPSHPELLQKLAAWWVQNDTNLRELVKLIAQSSAYQLSSQYEGEWSPEYVPLFARHHPRRLDAEEIHDAIVKASGVLPRYTWPTISAETVARGTALPQSDPVNWAMQLPGVNEPRGTAALTFLNNFTRGNRDTAFRNQSGSILQQLSLMNDNFVLSRIKMANSPVLKELAKLTDPGELVDELWLSFLSRKPTPVEREKAITHLTKTTPRNTAIEDLAWVAFNKIEFLFSY